MRTSLLQLLFWLLVLVVGAGLEDLLPKFLGVGFPILLVAAQVASREDLPTAVTVIVALAAGALEDALSSLPMMASASYFLLMAVLVRGFGCSRTATALTYPGYQLWLSLWMSGLGGGIFGRLLLSAPIGLLTASAVGVTVAWLGGKAAIYEQG